jgi:membrane-bound lytic murein transglycosylase A
VGATGAPAANGLASGGGRAAPPPPGGTGAGATTAPGAVVQRSRTRWIAARWSDLAGWDADALADWWPAFARGCERAPAAWAAMCAEARAIGGDATGTALRRWLEARLQPWRIETSSGAVEGLATGYFEPSVDASRVAQGAYRVPLYAPPPELGSQRPWWSRRQIDSLPHVQRALRGREIAWVRDRLDALLLQVQGSGRLDLLEPDGTRHLVRLAFAGHNDQPYHSVGRWLVEQGELKPDQASWPAIRSWASLHPERVNEMLWSNPRVVFFREEPLPDPEVGPRGAQGVPLTPGRSVAVDPQSVPYGAILWLDTTEPLSASPLRRAAMAQDTGGAIIGAVRVDLFFGWGTGAEAQAGRMKQALRLWVLWPKDTPPPL